MKTTAPALAQQRLTIVGLGLMGGSLALALQGRVAWLAGVDLDPGTLDLARQQSFLNQVSADLVEILPHTDLLVLAAPVRANLKILEQLPHWLPAGLAVIDLSSTKVAIQVAMEHLPPQFSALGGHPMCGKAAAGLAHAEASLFQGATFAWTANRRTTPELQSLAAQITRVTGAQELWLPADRHDQWTAATSHMPYVLSAALAAATPLDTRPLVGPGFRSTTRIAGSGTMMLDILLTNPAAILAALARVRSCLDEFEAALEAGDSERLQQWMTVAQARHAQLVRSGENTDELSD